MNTVISPPPHAASIERAAEWMLRHDRGLTPAEQDEFLQWLAADAEHRLAFAEQRRAWEALERLAGLPSGKFRPADLELPTTSVAPPRRCEWQPTAALLAAAAIVVALFVF